MRLLSMSETRSTVTSPPACMLSPGVDYSLILEIAEFAYILEADGFPESEIFRRIGCVHTPSPDFARLGRSGNPLRGYVVEHLSAHAPSYFKLGTQLLRTVLAFAELWAMHAAQRQRDARWPPEELIHPPGPLACILRDADEENEIDHLPSRTRAIEALDTSSEDQPSRTVLTFDACARVPCLVMSSAITALALRAFSS
jgi:hypothetical protein